MATVCSTMEVTPKRKKGKKYNNDVEDMAQSISEYLLKPLKLQNRWCFWYNYYIGPNKTVEEYENALQKLCTFDTVQDFWSYYNHLPAVSEIMPRCSFHLMKDGVKPLWEDEANAHGGNWTIKVKSTNTQYVWLEALLAVIGEQLQYRDDDDICGITVSVRKDGHNIFEIWNRTNNGHHQEYLDQFFRLVPEADFSDCPSPTYRVHQDLSGFNKH